VPGAILYWRLRQQFTYVARQTRNVDDLFSVDVDHRADTHWPIELCQVLRRHNLEDMRGVPLVSTCIIATNRYCWRAGAVHLDKLRIEGREASPFERTFRTKRCFQNSEWTSGGKRPQHLHRRAANLSRPRTISRWEIQRIPQRLFEVVLGKQREPELSGQRDSKSRLSGTWRTGNQDDLTAHASMVARGPGLDI